MLGFGAISSRGISGSPFSLVTVPLLMTASGSFITFGGSGVAGVFLPMTANSSFLTFGGSAQPSWTQTISASGSFLTFGGTAHLTLAGKAFRVRMIAEPFVVRKPFDKFTIKMVAAPYKIRGYR
jgi:hypothetical protein